MVVRMSAMGSVLIVYRSCGKSLGGKHDYID